MDNTPKNIVTVINGFLKPPNGSGPNTDNWTDLALPVGCLWAHAMNERFGWNWANLIQHDHDDLKVVAIVNADRSLAIFPFHYCFGCLEHDVQPTVLLAFNMLEAGRIPAQPSSGYSSLMDGVSHIVPPA